MRSEIWDLNKLADGGFKEKLTAAVLDVADNIMDKNTDPTKARKVTAVLSFKSDKGLEMVQVDIAVKTTLAPHESIQSRVVIGRDEKGTPQFQELLSGAKGQEYFDPDDSTLKHDDGTPVEDKPKNEPIDFRTMQAKEAK